MQNKGRSKTLTKLPKITCSPVKTSDKQRMLFKQDQNANKFTAATHAVFTQDLNLVTQYNKNMRREIASLTKMMTLLCTVKLCSKFKINITKCYFRVTTNAAGTRGTSAELETREWITIQDLLYGMMLPSGNDAANVLAENLGACIYYDRLGEAHLLVDLKSLDLTEDTWNIKIYTQQFVKIMNNFAKEIGMKDTFYVNPHGLDCSFRLEAYSNAQDQAILIKNLIENPQCAKIIGTQLYTAQLKTISGKEVEIRKVQWQNTNLLLAEQGFIGGKTGQTQNAGNCLASVYQTKNKEKFIIVMLGCGTKQLRFSQTRMLVEKYVLKQQ